MLFLVCSNLQKCNAIVVVVVVVVVTARRDVVIDA